jgi:hypothetical protein
MTKKRPLHEGNRSGGRNEKRKGTMEDFGGEQKVGNVHEPI